MKKIFTLLIIACAAWACGDDTESSGNGPGSITMQITQNILVEDKSPEVRAGENVDLTGYRLTLNNTAYDMPESRVISDLNPGKYQIELTNMPLAEDYIPAFDDPRYAGSAEADVNRNGTTPALIVLRQANSGIRFNYDESLEGIGLEDVVPSVVSGSQTLDYSAQREGTGYFMPGTASVSLKLGEESITIDGLESMEIETEIAQIWEITLSAGMSDKGGISIGVSWEIIEDPTVEKTWEVGVNLNVETKLTIEGLANTGVSLRYINANDAYVTLDDTGSTTLTKKPDVILHKIVLNYTIDMFVGRRTDGNDIFLKYDPVTESLLMRDAVNGTIPIGAAGELMLIDGNTELLQKDYKQEYDLYLNDMEWTPIGSTYSSPFKGSYDGDGHAIHNINVNRSTTEYSGFFGLSEEGDVSNLTIASGSVLGNRYVAGVVARVGNATVTNCVNNADITGTNYVGGVAGQVRGGATVDDCENHGTVNCTMSDGGGICSNLTGGTVKNSRNYGRIFGRNTLGGIYGTGAGSVMDCTNYGIVDGASSIGGISGTVGNNTVSECVNNGTVYVSNNSAGGIAGGVSNGGTIKDCENNGVIIATTSDVQTIGGIAGTVSNNALIQKCINNKEALFKNGYSRVGGIAGYLYQANIEECVNYADISGENQAIGGIVGENRANVTWATNYGEISGKEMIGGICGYNYDSGKLRMTDNYGKVYGANFVGGVTGSNFGTCSASYNEGLVVGTDEHAGGVAGTVAGAYGYLVACYNEGQVRGNINVGGVVGVMNMNGLVAACYSIGDVSGNENLGGVCGMIMDDLSTITSCYWSGYKWDAVGDGTEQDIYYFDDGTDGPAGYPTGWPEETMENWGENTPGNDGMNGLWWDNLGSKGTAVYPMLWWEGN